MENRRGLSHLEFSQRGIKESYLDLSLNISDDIPLMDREFSVFQLMSHALNVHTTRLKRNNIALLYGSPGMGKTRLLEEILRLYFSENDEVRSAAFRTMFVPKKVDELNKIVPIAVTFNGANHVNYDDVLIYKIGKRFPIVCRVLYHWFFSEYNFNIFRKSFLEFLRAGTSNFRDFELGVLFSFISERSGGKRVLLMIDEILLLFNELNMGEQEMVQFVKLVCDGQDIKRPQKHAVVFTSVHLSEFDKVRTTTGRFYYHVNLPYISSSKAKMYLGSLQEHDFLWMRSPNLTYVVAFLDIWR